MAGGGGQKKRLQYCSDSSGTILYLRALQGHSGRSLIDPSLQDNVIIPDGFVKYMYHVGFAINLHFIIKFRIDTGRTKFEQQTDSILSACGSCGAKNRRILKRSTWKHRVLHNTCTKHGRNIKIRCIEPTPTLLWRKDWSSIKHDRTLLFFTKHSQAYCIPKVVRMETGEVIYEKVYASTRPPPKISLTRDWMKRFGSRSCSTTRRKSCATSKKVPNQANQIQTQIMIERGNPQRGALHSQEIETRSFREEAVRHDRTVKPVVCPQEGAPQTRFSRDSPNFNVEDETNHDRKEKLVVCRDAKITSAQC